MVKMTKSYLEQIYTEHLDGSRECIKFTQLVETYCLCKEHSEMIIITT